MIDSGYWILGIRYWVLVVGCGSERSVDPAESGIAGYGFETCCSGEALES